MLARDSTTLREFFREAFGPLDAPPAAAPRLRLFARVSLWLVLPLVLLPTAFAHTDAVAKAHAPASANHLLWLWMACAVLFVLGMATVLMVRGEGRAARLGLMASAVGLLGTNEVSLLTIGSMNHWATLYIVSTIASYRVFLDYGIGRFATIFGGLALAMGAVTELYGWLPLGPYLPEPPSIPVYEDPASCIGQLVTAEITIGLTFGAVNYGMNQSHKLHRYITWSVLARYLPPSMVARAADGELRLDDPPDRRVVTVVFTDLVGFTSMTERLGADAVATLLNRYLSEMSTLAHRHGATVDKFVGDAVMLVFGAPEPMTPAEQARRALALAREMIAHTATLPGEQLQLRAGLETGEAVVGNFGSSTRSDYTVIGSAVNLAARLETAAPPGGIFVGPGAAALLEDAELMEVGELQLKGLSTPVRTYQAPP